MGGGMVSTAANSITLETVIFGNGEGTALGFHNAYLNALIEGGIVSLSLLVLISLSLLYQFYVGTKQKQTEFSVYLWWVFVWYYLGSF